MSCTLHRPPILSHSRIINNMNILNDTMASPELPRPPTPVHRRPSAPARERGNPHVRVPGETKPRVKASGVVLEADTDAFGPDSRS